jgi:predicted restriction endonuclease
MITSVYPTSTWVTTTNPTQVYDGNGWLTMGNGSSVGLTSNAEQALAWAWLKMQQEKAAQDLAQKHPSVADALDAVRLAEQQLQTVVALCTV